jgi:hypothetical protein
LARLGLDGEWESTEAASTGNITLQFNHALLVAGGIFRVSLKLPAKELVGVVGLELGIKDAESLSIPGHLVPVTLHILQILREVREAALKHLSVQLRSHNGLEVDVFGPGLVRLGKHKVSGLFHGTEESADLLRVLLDEGLVANVKDGAEAAAAQFSEFINAEHLDVCLGAALFVEPFLELNHLNILKANASVNLAGDDGLGHVHSAADGSIVLRSEAIVGGEFVNLDFAKLAHVANALALEGAEVGGDARLLEINDTSEWFIKKAANRDDREATGLGLEYL